MKIACWHQAPWPVNNLAGISTDLNVPVSARSAANEGGNEKMCNLRVKSSSHGLGVSLIKRSSLKGEDTYPECNLTIPLCLEHQQKESRNFQFSKINLLQKMNGLYYRSD
jgi:hypothetical protein